MNLLAQLQIWLNETQQENNPHTEQKEADNVNANEYNLKAFQKETINSQEFSSGGGGA